MPPALDLHYGADGALPHSAGQIMGQCAGHRSTLASDAVLLVGTGDKALLLHLGQSVGKFKVIDQLLLQKRTLQGIPRQGTGCFDKIAK